VLGEAIAQLPARYRRNLLITCDGAGASLSRCLCKWIGQWC